MGTYLGTSAQDKRGTTDIILSRKALRLLCEVAKMQDASELPAVCGQPLIQIVTDLPLSARQIFGLCW